MLTWIEENFDEYDKIKNLLEEGELDEENINEIIAFIKDNLLYNIEYLLSNKTDFTSSISETWDNVGDPFADHPIE